MTEGPAAPVAEPAPPGPPAPARPRRPWRWLAGAGFLVLAAAVGWLWFQQMTGPPSPATARRLATLDARIARIEQRPAPGQNADIRPLADRLAALERPNPDLAALRDRIMVLEQRPAGDLASLTTRLTALEQGVAGAERLARLQAASAALAAGLKLGDIPGAPPALARFAAVNPPTEAALRLAFPAAELAALNASRPADDDRPILARMLARAEALVTVRRGDHVLVGDPAAGILARARIALDAGDLPGAIAALSSLRGAPAEAMAAWVADAAALRDARMALTAMVSRP